jgi:hypothetical protein
VPRAAGGARSRACAPSGTQAIWDDEYLYVGAELHYDGPAYSIHASFTERNSPIYQQDSDIEVFPSRPVVRCDAARVAQSWR